MSGRPPLDVSHPLKFHNWLVEHVGTQTLPGFFVRDGSLVRVPRLGEDGYRRLTDNADDDDGPAQVRPADATVVRAVIARTLRPFVLEKTKKDGPLVERDVLPPFDPVNLYVAGVAESGTAAQTLRGVVHSPFLRPDGSIVTAPGYDRSTRLLHLPPVGLVLPEIPVQPTCEDVALAAKVLSGVVAEFPFVTDHDRANYIGALILGPLLRPIVPPPYPITALSAHMAGSGKTLLAQIAQELHGGVFRSEPSHSDDEIRKLITSILLCTSAPLIVLDNLTGTFRSGQFAALATSSAWSDRPLGSTAQVNAPNDRLWVLTGNNISLGGDMPRRVPVWARIDADCPDPHLRNGFSVPDLIGHVRRSRADLLAAALLLVRAWVLEGSPRHGEKRHDSFGDWIRSVAGILQIAGIEGDFASPAVAREASPVGSEDDEAAEFLAALAARFTEGFHSRDLVHLIHTTAEKQHRAAKSEAGDQWVGEVVIDPLDSAVLDSLPEELVEKIRNTGFSKSVGRWLKYRVGQWKGGYVLRHRTDHDATRFHLSRWDAK